MSAPQPEYVKRTFDQLNVGDVVFVHNSMPIDAIRNLGITGSKSASSIRTRIHPTIILHKNDATRVMTGVTASNKPKLQIPQDRQKYFVEQSEYAGGQTGVIIIAGYNTINAAGDPPPTVCCTFKPNPSQKNLIISFNTYHI